jgi:hypothetical protein
MVSLTQVKACEQCGCAFAIGRNRQRFCSKRCADLALADPKEDIVQRFFRLVLKTETCWLWQGALDKNGYGTFVVGSRTDGSRRHVKAHRWAYERFVGPIPLGFEPDHVCRVNNCVRPDPHHLEVVTHRENVRRGRAGILAQPGQHISRATLTATTVCELRTLWAAGMRDLGTLTRRFGVTRGTIWRVVTRRGWTHV